MPFYHVTVEADGLAFDGAKGFFANRYVLADTPAEARRRAVAMTLRDWTTGGRKGASGKVPNVFATDSAKIGFLDYLSGRRQNHRHVFYEED